MERIGPTAWITNIAPGLWLHTTTATIAGGYVFPANGLIVDRPKGSLLIDTGYTPEQSDLLLQWSRSHLSSPIALALVIHFHRDRTGGIDGLTQYGIRTLASPLTCRLAREHKVPVPQPIAGFRVARFRLDNDCELFFPGAGHTRDNIVAWLPKQRVLFGGCLLKSVSSDDLGNVADSVLSEWPGSVKRLQIQYGNPLITIPGHGAIAGDPTAHTLVLLAQEAAARS